MAAKKPATKKPAAKPTPKTRTAARTKAATKLGFEGDVGAMKATTRQYGLVKGENGKWVRPSMDFLENQVSGWLSNPQTQTPVNIGGMRMMVGQGVVSPTGMRSDSAKRGPGGSYLDPSGEYSAAGYGAKGGKGKGKGKGKPKGGGAAGSAPPATTEAAPFGGPEQGAFVPYAEADVATTNMTRAQGKGYGRGAGVGLAGGTSTPPESDSTVVEGASEGGGGRRKPRKGKRPLKKKVGKKPTAAKRRTTTKGKK